MTRTILIIAAWCVLMLCVASFKIGYETMLDKSWQAYADDYVQWAIAHGEAR